MEKTAPALSISITAPDHVKTGTDVKLDVAVTNTSDHEVYYSPFGAGTVSPTSLDVRDADGNTVPAIPNPRKELPLPPPKPGEGRAGGFSASTSGIRIGSGKTIHLERVINKEFDLGKPGKYTVQLAHQLDGVLVKSNAVTVTVDP
jgi:hypothetical protein